jgi:hypothetical protein
MTVALATIDETRRTCDRHHRRPSHPVSLLLRSDARKDSQATLHRSLPSPMPLRRCSIVDDDDPPVSRSTSTTP